MQVPSLNSSSIVFSSLSQCFFFYIQRVFVHAFSRLIYFSFVHFSPIFFCFDAFIPAMFFVCHFFVLFCYDIFRLCFVCLLYIYCELFYLKHIPASARNTGIQTLIRTSAGWTCLSSFGSKVCSARFNSGLDSVFDSTWFRARQETRGSLLGSKFSSSSTAQFGSRLDSAQLGTRFGSVRYSRFGSGTNPSILPARTKLEARDSAPLCSRLG